ncbi:MAG: class E sortase, partial [Actinomycetota bacterium]
TPTPTARSAGAPRGSGAVRQIVRIGSLRIPSIGLDAPVFEGGESLAVLNYGPGHMTGTAYPGEMGNTVFAGHRVTHTHPFFNLDRVKVGDPIIVSTDAGTFTYRMTEQKVVRPTDTWILNQTQEFKVTLFGCHPKHSASYRIVVIGILES